MKRKIISIILTVMLTFGTLAFEPGYTLTASAAEQGESFITMPVNGFNSANTGTAENKTVRISGDATLDGKGGVMIVSNAGNKAGGVFFTQPISQGSGFSTSFKIHMGASKTGPADGFTFVIANATNQVGANGQGIGYSGITKSIAIEYDTYDNKSKGSTGNVPHIWYGNNGTMDTNDAKTSVIFEKNSSGVSAKRNATNYTVYGWAEFKAETNKLSVTFSSSATRPTNPSIIIQDGSSDSEVTSGGTMTITRKNFKPGNPSSPYYIGNQYYMGFTAATGGYYQEVTLQGFSAYGEYVENTGASKSITINGKEVEIGSGLDLPSITPPSAPSGDGRFQGIYSEPNGGGEQYYDSNGNGVHANDLEDGQVLYPYFSYSIKLKNQGVSDTTLPATDNAQLPATVPVPVRDGYVFVGYYDDITSEAECYYNGSGARQKGDIWRAANGPTALYAKWSRGDAAVTVNLNGGTWSAAPDDFAGSGSNYSVTLAGGTVVVLPQPTKENAFFAGWSVTGTGGSVSANGRTLTAIGGTVTLTARWTIPGTAFVNKTGEAIKDKNDDNTASELASAFESKNLATDPENGIVAADLAAENVTLTLVVDNVGEETSGVSAINTLARKIGGADVLGRLKFYDIYVEKNVDDVKSRLKEIPETVTVSIPLTGNLAGALSYVLYHYHDGEVRLLTDDNSNEEYFEVIGGEMLIHVRRFSEFGILPNGRTIGPDSESELAEDPMNGDHEPGIDVQGKVCEGELGKVYKLDIAWGAMKFEYSVGREWDPETHDYTGDKINDWIPTVDSQCYTGGNNQITVYNHSNDGVELTFTVGDIVTYLDGVEIKVFKSNADEGSPAVDMPLERVAFNGDQVAPSEDVFVRLLGSPSNVQDFLDAQTGSNWNKVAVITVTIVPSHGEITPLN